MLLKDTCQQASSLVEDGFGASCGIKLENQWVIVELEGFRGNDL